MDKKRKFSKKALRDFELIDAAIEFNDQNAFSELMANYKKSIYYTILKMIRDPDDAEDLTILGGVWNPTKGLYISPNIYVFDDYNTYRLTCMFKY